MDEETRNDLTNRLREEFFATLKVSKFDDKFFSQLAEVKYLQTIQSSLDGLKSHPELKHIPPEIFKKVGNNIDIIICDLIEELDQTNKEFFQEFQDILGDVISNVD